MEDLIFVSKDFGDMQNIKDVTVLLYAASPLLDFLGVWCPVEGQDNFSMAEWRTSRHDVLEVLYPSDHNVARSLT